MNLDKQYLDLLKCNTKKISGFDISLLKEEWDIYNTSLNDWSNYGGVPTLEQWKHPNYVYPNIHPIHKKIVDTVELLKPATVCDVGAGAGTVAKYVYNLDSSIQLNCVEGNDVHIEQMKNNFDHNFRIIPPYITVNANILKAAAQSIPIESNSQDLVYTCTVLMHIPFLMAVKAIQEIARINRKHVLHLERKDGNVVIGNQKSDLNYLEIDYPSIYEKLGFKTVKYEEFPYPENEHLSCIYYLGEK